MTTYAHCEIFTNLPGMACPLCGVAIRPNIGHFCVKEVKPVGKTGGKKRKKVGHPLTELYHNAGGAR